MARKDVERRAWAPLEVARMTGLSKSTVYRLLADGTIFSTRAGDRYIIPAEALTAFLEGRKYSPPKR